MRTLLLTCALVICAGTAHAEDFCAGFLGAARASCENMLAKCQGDEACRTLTRQNVLGQMEARATCQKFVSGKYDYCVNLITNCVHLSTELSQAIIKANLPSATADKHFKNASESVTQCFADISRRLFGIQDQYERSLQAASGAEAVELLEMRLQAGVR